MLKRIISEAHRRSLWQVLGIYLVASWAGFEVISELTDRVGLPDWVPAFALVLFIIGLPVVLATAFVQEGGPRRRPDTPTFEPHDPTLFPAADRPLTIDQPAEPAVATKPVIDIAYGKHHILFTWPKAVVGGVVAFLLLGISASGYMGMRNAGIGPFGSLVASGALDQRDRVLIADFNGIGIDSTLAQAVTQAFRVSFAQSTVVTVLEPGYVRGVLKRMQREDALDLPLELAREVAERDNIKAVVTGEVSRAGGAYAVAAKLIVPATGAALASYSETVTDTLQILAAVERVSKKLRERIGESLRTIRAERPLDAVTTSSLPALRKYAQGALALDAQGDHERAASLLEEAIALDTTFAMAWRKLAAVYNNARAGPAKIAHAATMAYENRERLTDLERYLTIGFYHWSVTQDHFKVIDAYQSALELQPNNYIALTNIGNSYVQVREFAKAADAYARRIQTDTAGMQAWNNLVVVLPSVVSLDSARVVLKKFHERFGETPEYYENAYLLATAEGRYDEAVAHARKIGEVRRTSLSWQSRGLFALRDVATVQGRLAEADRYGAALIDNARQRGMKSIDIETTVHFAEVDLYVRRDPASALRRLDAGVTTAALEAVSPRERPYLRVVQLYALGGRADAARRYLAEYERNVPLLERGDDRRDRYPAEGLIAFAEQQYGDAVDKLRRGAELGPCLNCLDTEIALVFEAAAQPDSAIAHYEHYLSLTSSPRILEDWRELAGAYERLAELYEQRGNRQKAIEHATKFVELWRNADAELQPRVRSKQQMIQRLTRT